MKTLWALFAVSSVVLGVAGTSKEVYASLPPIDRNWNVIQVRVDLKNLTDSDGKGSLPQTDLLSRIEGVNEIWSICSIKFVPRAHENVSAGELKAPYPPKSRADLDKIASLVAPQYDNSIPLTFAGPWNFVDSESGLYLHGLGWEFHNGDQIAKVGAIINANKVMSPSSAPIIAHELAHALSLPHTAEAENLMGMNGPNVLTIDQCIQARKFALTTLVKAVL